MEVTFFPELNVVFDLLCWPGVDRLLRASTSSVMMTPRTLLTAEDVNPNYIPGLAEYY